MHLFEHENKWFIYIDEGFSYGPYIKEEANNKMEESKILSESKQIDQKILMEKM